MENNQSVEHSQWFIHYRDKGDISAFQKVMNAYHLPLFNYLRRQLRKKEDAEDALQEVWFRVVRQRDSYREKGQFSSWLYRIAHNYCIDHFRKQNTRLDQKERVEDSEGVEWLSRIASDEPSPWDLIEEKEQLQLLEKAVDQLPVAIREVYILRAVHDIPFKEISEIQNAPLGTVLSRMHQAVKRLQSTLQTELELIRENTA